MSLTSAAKPRIRERARITWTRMWKEEEFGRELYRLESTPDKKVLMKYRGLYRPRASMLVQMRTGKIGLKSYLKRIKASDTKMCSCGGVENIQHVLLQCPKWNDLREKHLGPPARRDTNLSTLLSTPASAKKATILIKDTGLLT